MSGKNKIIFCVLGVVIGLIIGLGIAVRFDFSSNVKATDAPAAAPVQIDLEKAVENVAASAGKAVVSISTERTQKFGGQPNIRRYSFGGNPYQGGPFEDEFFQKFFDDFFGEMPEREYKQQGLGSGVIIDKEGYILTNDHVISQADKISVTHPDGRVFKAELKGTDSRSDLAVIKISGGDFPAAPLGDSDALKIGQWVVAIGNPFGFAIQNPEPTVTIGVVSALHRSLGRTISGERDYGDLIQTDAAINPGNSGGPLVNLKGEIIGINTAIFSTSGGYQGIGFAIPVNSARRIVSKLIAGKKIVYGWLGITVQELDEKLRAYFGLGEKKGVLVASVIKNGPAEKAGIKEGDVILKFDGREIPSVRELLNAVGKAEVGAAVSVELLRNKNPLTVSVKIGERQENLELTPSGAAQDMAGSYWRGIKVSALTPELARRYRLGTEQGAVVITEVKPNSAADEAGLMEGDVILEINRKPIDSGTTYDAITKNAKGDCLLRTSRGFFVIKSEN